MPTIHPSLTLARVERAVRRAMRDADAYPGFCLTCGRSAKQPCEPDARAYPCLYRACGQPTVCGAEELLLMIAV